MDFATAIKTCLTNRYADFAGRATRPEFWYFQLFLFIAGLITFVIDDAILQNEMAPISLIFSLATLVPNIAVSTRRLHDLGKSGWWILIGFVPLIGWILLIVWYASKGEAADNRFGSPALAGASPVTPA